MKRLSAFAVLTLTGAVCAAVLGIPPGRTTVRDLWAHRDLGIHTDWGTHFDRRFRAKVPSHGVVLLRIRPV